MDDFGAWFNRAGSDVNESNGSEVGERCGRDGCDGVIADDPFDERGCYCHATMPPCGNCTTPRECCPECGWRLEDEGAWG